ncbi:MAG: DUF2961 domain-containing protein [Armatimonadetes bacterium]|nr:DUF2961 domain-containing protein [Armatimonadota bacterium]
MRRLTAIATVALTLVAAHARADDGTPGFVERMRIQDAATSRISSWDRTGGNMDFLQPKPGDRLVLADIRGAGCIRHFYWAYIIEDAAVRESLFRNLILRMYWDDEKTPSVECPIGDFFLVSNGLARPVQALDFVINPGMGRNNATSYGMNCYLPMAFSKRARIEVTYDAAPGSTRPGGFWYHIDHETYSNEPDWMRTVGRFHAQFRRSSPTKAVNLKDVNRDGKENYVILEAKGEGHVAGYMLGVDNLVGSWWGEGDDMIVVDGRPWPPAYHGTGSEEIFGGGACPDVEYSGPYTGFHLVENRDKDPWFGKNAMYRFFVRDPIRFGKSIKVSIEHGHANDLANGYSSVAYWYQREPHAPFPALPDRAGRRPNHKYPPGPGDIPDAIEAEALIETARTGGAAPTAIRFAGKWSKGRFLWYIGKGSGDYLSIQMDVPSAGRYALSAWMTRATDFGIVQLLVDGKPLGEPFDGYNGEGGYGPTHVVRADGIEFGEVDLTAGAHTLRLRLTGKNARAIGHMIGVDCLVLKRVNP